MVLFVSFWISLIIVILGYSVVLGWIAFLADGSPRDIREITEMWSIPLGVVNSAFVVRPDKSFVAVLGIVSANCYFWALGLALVFKVVHGVLRRSRVTELGISSSVQTDDDDEI